MKFGKIGIISEKEVLESASHDIWRSKDRIFELIKETRPFGICFENAFPGLSQIPGIEIPNRFPKRFYDLHQDCHSVLEAAFFESHLSALLKGMTRKKLLKIKLTTALEGEQKVEPPLQNLEEYKNKVIESQRDPVTGLDIKSIKRKSEECAKEFETSEEHREEFLRIVSLCREFIDDLDEELKFGYGIPYYKLTMEGVKERDKVRNKTLGVLGEPELA